MKQLRALFTVLNLHLAGLAVFLLLDIFLGAGVILAMRAIKSDESPAFATEEIHYGRLQARMSQIQNLPAKVADARKQAAKFTDARIAPNYSTIAAELGNLAAKENVSLTHAQYTPKTVTKGITQVQIDASLTGQYAPLMHFINNLERDKHHVFFIITALNFNGQQGGLVSVQIRIDTYLRSSATDLPASSAPSNSGSNNSGNSTALLHNPLPQFASREVR
jgi:type IV pilus assembly protein PilO